MQNSKQKISRLTRRATPPDRKSVENNMSHQNLKEYLMPKRSCKHPTLKNTSSKQSTSSKKILINNKSYLFNKTAFGTPLDKSTILSYLSTPNQKSFNMEKFKLLRGDKSLNQTKTKEYFQSTEDQNYSEESVKVTFWINGKKFFSKFFANFVKLSSLSEEFVGEYQKSKGSSYGLSGFQVSPFNYALTTVINEGQHTFKWLLNQSIRQVNLTAILIKKPINYDHLEFSDFEILKFLGSGGFSQVYLAKCKIDNQYCALKFIRKDTITSAKKAKMLQNQKNILFTIKHQNLIDLYYAFQSKNFIVFGLEYCPNGNLYSFLQKVKCINEDLAKSIFTQILKGLEYLHQNNILFRDIKLENILFDSNGKIKITDFGLSKPDIDQNEVTYSYCGSPEYMAPQMLTKSGHSFQVDYYALGILLYQLLFGRSPFYAPRKEDIFMAILNSEPKFPKTPTTSKEVKSLIKGLLTKNPNHRIGSLKGVKQILSHPWLRNAQTENVPLVTFPNVDILPSSSNKELQNIKEMFTVEQANKNFEKCFFPQNFVNRILFQKITSKIIKFKKEKETKLKNNFLKNPSTSKRK